MKRIVSIFLLAIMLLVFCMGCNSASNIKQNLTLIIDNKSTVLTPRQLRQIGFSTLDVSISNDTAHINTQVKGFDLMDYMAKENGVDEISLISVTITTADAKEIVIPAADMPKNTLYVIAESDSGIDSVGICVPDGHTKYYIKSGVTSIEIMRSLSQGVDLSTMLYVVHEVAKSVTPVKMAGNDAYSVSKIYTDYFGGMPGDDVTLTAINGSAIVLPPAEYANCYFMLSDKSYQCCDSNGDVLLADLLYATGGAASLFFGVNAKVTDVLATINLIDLGSYSIFYNYGNSLTISKAVFETCTFEYNEETDDVFIALPDGENTTILNSVTAIIPIIIAAD